MNTKKESQSKVAIWYISKNNLSIHRVHFTQ